MIEGELRGDFVLVAEECCAQALAENPSICVVLKQVSVIDDRGFDMLRRLALRGVALRGTGLYTEYLVKSLVEEEKS